MSDHCDQNDQDITSLILYVGVLLCRHNWNQRRGRESIPWAQPYFDLENLSKSCTKSPLNWKHLENNISLFGTRYSQHSHIYTYYKKKYLFCMLQFDVSKYRLTTWTDDTGFLINRFQNGRMEDRKTTTVCWCILHINM